MQLVKGVDARVYPVGRLDADSAGLLILSNDGDFTKQLTHPSYQVPKTYRAVVRGRVLAATIAQLARGITLEDGLTAPAQLESVDYDSANNASIIDITIREGRNRQIRRMFLAVHHPVLALTRTAIGPLKLRGLPPGKWRKLHSAEINQLLEIAKTNFEKARPSPKTPPQPEAPIRNVPASRRKPSESKNARRGGSIPPATNEAREAALELNRKLREGGVAGRRDAVSGRRPRRPRAS